uniref:Uncharacterized protein n=1 Tax=Bemisia tabaci TaxID=7038 RepID=A0A9E7VCL6_BEMTA|nr:hypothetical protein [Bemisia tabaci]
MLKLGALILLLGIAVCDGNLGSGRLVAPHPPTATGPTPEVPPPPPAGGARPPPQEPPRATPQVTEELRQNLILKYVGSLYNRLSQYLPQMAFQKDGEIIDYMVVSVLSLREELRSMKQSMEAVRRSVGGPPASASFFNNFRFFKK